MGLDIYLLEKSRSGDREDEGDVWVGGITHNLTTMAKEAGIYKLIWRPEEVNCCKAKDVTTELELALIDLEERPKHFKKFNPPNKWGNYANLVEFVKKYIDASKEYSEFYIHACR